MRDLRNLGDEIVPPLPHNHHQKFVEQEQRVARAIKAERNRNPQAA